MRLENNMDQQYAVIEKETATIERKMDQQNAGIGEHIGLCLSQFLPGRMIV